MISLALLEKDKLGNKPWAPAFQGACPVVKEECHLLLPILWALLCFKYCTQGLFLELSSSKSRWVHDRLHVYPVCGIFYFPWHRYQIEGTDAFWCSFEQHGEGGVDGITKVLARCRHDSNPGPFGRHSYSLTTAYSNVVTWLWSEGLIVSACSESVIGELQETINVLEQEIEMHKEQVTKGNRVTWWQVGGNRNLKVGVYLSIAKVGISCCIHGSAVKKKLFPERHFFRTPTNRQQREKASLKVWPLTANGFVLT